MAYAEALKSKNNSSHIMKNIYLVAQEFETPGNCGAMARVAKNFECGLVFLSPKCDPFSKEAMDRAANAKDALKKAKVVSSFKELKADFDYLVGTTSIVSTDYNIPRSPLSPKQLAGVINTKRFAILIGREGKGLNNEEISECDFIVSIPTSKKYPVMNVSHAAAIILYEIFDRVSGSKLADNITAASRKDRDVVLDLAMKAIDNLHFTTEDRKDTQRRLWKRIIGKSFLTKREAFALCGFFKKIR